MNKVVDLKSQQSICISHQLIGLQGNMLMLCNKGKRGRVNRDGIESIWYLVRYTNQQR